MVKQQQKVFLVLCSSVAFTTKKCLIYSPRLNSHYGLEKPYRKQIVKSFSGLFDQFLLILLFKWILCSLHGYFVCLQNHVEGYHELSSKTQIYFSTAVAKWDADFYIKVDDDVHINIG